MEQAKYGEVEQTCIIQYQDYETLINRVLENRDNRWDISQMFDIPSNDVYVNFWCFVPSTQEEIEACRQAYSNFIWTNGKESEKEDEFWDWEEVNGYLIYLGVIPTAEKYLMEICW